MEIKVWFKVFDMPVNRNLLAGAYIGKQTFTFKGPSVPPKYWAVASVKMLTPVSFQAVVNW